MRIRHVLATYDPRIGLSSMNVVKAACSGLCIIVVICGIFSTGRSIPVADSKSILRIESVQLLLECLPTVFSGEIRFTSNPARLFPCRMMLPRRIRSSCVTYIDGSHPYWLRNARFSRSRSKDAVHRYRLLHADPGSPHAELVVFCRHYNDERLLRPCDSGLRRVLSVFHPRFQP